MNERDFSKEKKIKEEYDNNLKRSKKLNEEFIINDFMKLKDFKYYINRYRLSTENICKEIKKFDNNYQKIIESLLYIFSDDDLKSKTMEKYIEERIFGFVFSEMEKLNDYFKSTKKSYDFREIGIKLALFKKDLRENYKDVVEKNNAL